MATFNELMQKYVNTDYEVLLSFGKEAVSRVLPVCKQVDPDHNGYYMLTAIILSAIGADGVLSALEKKLLTEMMDLKEALVDAFIRMYDPAMVEVTHKFCDDISEDVKADTIMLVTIIAAVDEKISREETAFIKELFA